VPADPARGLRPRERRAVRAYSWLLLSGTAATLVVAAFITVPATVSLLAHAFGELAGPAPTDRADGAAALVVTGGFQLAWIRAWWRHHSHQLSSFLRTRKGGDSRATNRTS
jgi:putative peptide zinc metalloprotease protein